MANKDSPSEFRSVSGQEETAEPSSNGATRAPTSKTSSAQKHPPAQPSTTTSTSTSIPSLRKSSSSNLAPQISSPLAQSPRTSRNASPIRRDKQPAVSAMPGTQPSAAALQRALSSSSIPQLQQQSAGFQDSTPRVSRGNKSTAGSGENTPTWPLSPRLKSPPPSGPNSRRGSAAAQKKPDAPSIQVQSATSQSHSTAPQTARQISSDNPKADTPQLQPPPPPKTAARGPSGKSMLETVQENSTDPQEPSPAALQAAADLKPLTKISGNEGAIVQDASKAEEQNKAQLGESGSESAGNKSDSVVRGRRSSSSQGTGTSQPQRPRNASKSTYSASARSRQGEGKQNMTVETETVQSIPQSGLAPASEGAGRLRTESGSVKLKPSNETIRPKKERKKTERKTRSVNQGTATSKADLFEARVANHMDEANSSDSEETFVYESNPPEPQRRQRHHSRTPSVTSSHSTADQQRGGLRNYVETYDERRVGGKRSMKFSSNPYTDVDSPDNKDGTVRTHTPRHIGRFGRGGHHSATYDQHESPFTQASKLRQNQSQRSRPNSPKSQHSINFRSGAGLFSGSRKQEQPYDFDAEQNADDERTPLMGTVRGPRNFRNARRIVSSTPQSLSDYSDEGTRWNCLRGRAGSCCLTALVVILVIVSSVGFVFGSNRPLQNVEIRKMQNVLASEQELMLDLLVGALNPNALGITISDSDLNIFAKSKHVGTVYPPGTKPQSNRGRSPGPESEPHQDLSGHWHAPETLPDVERDAQTMLLGHVFHFDQSLAFDASPIKQQMHFSSGQVRLAKPGNETESGGSARWEKMIQYPFELIVRGVLKYQLPISSRLQKVAVGASVMVHPEDGIDRQGNMRVEPIDHSEHWQWIDWPEVLEGVDDEKLVERWMNMKEVE